MPRDYNSVLQIRLPRELRDEFAEAAKAEGRQVSDLIRSYIESYVFLRKKLRHDEIERLKQIL